MLLKLPDLVNLKHKMGKGAKPLFEDNELKSGFMEEVPGNDTKAKMLTEMELLSLDLSAHPLDFYHFDNGLLGYLILQIQL